MKSALALAKQQRGNMCGVRRNVVDGVIVYTKNANSVEGKEACKTLDGQIKQLEANVASLGGGGPAVPASPLPASPAGAAGSSGNGNGRPQGVPGGYSQIGRYVGRSDHDDDDRPQDGVSNSASASGSASVASPVSESSGDGGMKIELDGATKEMMAQCESVISKACAAAPQVTTCPTRGRRSR